jgi:hypothetical protein
MRAFTVKKDVADAVVELEQASPDVILRVDGLSVVTLQADENTPRVCISRRGLRERGLELTIWEDDEQVASG